MFDRLRRRIARWLTRSISPSDPFWSDVYLNLQTSAGVQVSEEKALQLSGFWAAVNIYASTIGQLPIEVRLYDDTADSFLPSDDVLFAHQLRFKPNSEQTIFTFMETMQSNAHIWGAGYAEIEWDASGRPVALWPLNSRSTKRIRLDGRIVVQTSVDGKNYYLELDDVIYIPGPLGRSVIQVARESIALGIATERYGARFFGSGGIPSAVLEHPGELGQEAQERIRRQMEERHGGGIERSHRLMILEEGMKFQKISVPPEDAQFLATRSFQTVEMARWFNLPPHFLGDLSRSSYATTEQMSQEFITFSLSPWISKWEQELQTKLFGDPEKTGIAVKMDTNVLLRGDRLTRYKAHNISLTSGWSTVNEVRTEEGKPRVDGGDVLLRPLNMSPIGEIVPHDENGNPK